jgi:hypothetical protein
MGGTRFWSWTEKPSVVVSSGHGIGDHTINGPGACGSVATARWMLCSARMARVRWLEKTLRDALELDLDGLGKDHTSQTAPDLGLENALLGEVDLVAMRVGPVFDLPGQPIDFPPAQSRRALQEIRNG